MNRTILHYHRILDGLPKPGLEDIYHEQVRQVRTRTVGLAGRPGPVSVMRTLLGYEIKTGNHRKGCPDLATARYLAVFASLGLPQVEIPYNPVVTGQLLPALEAARSLLDGEIERLAPAAAGRRRHRYVRQRIYQAMMKRLLEGKPAHEP